MKRSFIMLLLVATVTGTPNTHAEAKLHWLSDGYNNRDLTIHPDGNLMLTTLMSPKSTFAAIVIAKKVDGKWTQPTVAPFSGSYQDIEAMFNPAGTWLYFASKRPKPDREGDDWDLWRVSYAEGIWGEPVHLGNTVNTEGDEFYPSVANSGNLYFTATRDKDNREDIYVAMPVDGEYALVKALGPGVNSKTWEFNAFIDPEEQFLIFGSQRRPDEVGGGDLYISYRNNGVFQPALILSSDVNTPKLDYCPYVKDGTLYFSSERLLDIKKPATAASLRDNFFSPGNGLGDLYSVPMADILVGDASS